MTSHRVEQVAEDDIGQRIRSARIAQGLSLRRVASAIGVSASLLSLVENGRTKPSIGTLTALVGHFGISFDDVMGESADAGAGAGGATEDSGPRFGSDHPFLVTLEPGATLLAGGAGQPDATEYAYVVSGELTLCVDPVVHILRAGDSLTLEGGRPAEYRNDGRVAVEVVRFLTGGA
ncbi:helix-turn-helix domain-containing protein [Herbiconiux solani]|uniref:helix-turn-helix domain-containing protein n=1 Tax=Herbiconiux solani TaxID=661329 RepID=UPI0012ECE60C|nr:XRE family transcriptional regulator [Herbiconiux solani]